MEVKERVPPASGSDRNSGSRPGALSLLLFAPTDALIIQAPRFAAVGAIATVIDMSTLYVFTSILGVFYLLSAALGFILGTTAGYLIAVRWVFASRTLSNRALEFTAFVLVGVIGLGLTEIMLWVGVTLAHLHYMYAKSIAVAILFAWNFGARRAMLFRRTKHPDGS